MATGVSGALAQRGGNVTVMFTGWWNFLGWWWRRWTSVGKRWIFLEELYARINVQWAVLCCVLVLLVAVLCQSDVPLTAQQRNSRALLLAQRGLAWSLANGFGLHPHSCSPTEFVW